VNLLLLGFPVLNFASREAMLETLIHACGYRAFSQARTKVMLRRSNIFIGIGRKFATSSVGAKSDRDRHAKRSLHQQFDGRNRVQFAAPTELAAHLARNAIKIYLLRRMELRASALLEASTAFATRLENELRAHRQTPKTEHRTRNANGHAWSLKDQ